MVQPLLWGTPLLAVAVVVGVIWSKLEFGEFWFWDIKTIVTTGAVIFYASILYFYYGTRQRSKRIALLSVFAFSLILMGFVGTRFIAESHNYLQNNRTPSLQDETKVGS